MKVVQLVGGDLTRGAHRGAYWLHCGLRSIGVESYILGPIPYDQVAEDVVSISANGLGVAKDMLVRKLGDLAVDIYAQTPGTTFSTGFLGRNVVNHPLIHSADIVNLHWISKGTLSLNAIRRIRKPVVWTLRDMWPFTGGCHHAMECGRYQEYCGSCPQLRSRREKDLSRLIQYWKGRCIPDSISIVGISRWISDCARQSNLLRNHNIRTIYNCIDTELFYPVSKEVARSALGLPRDKKIILTAAGSFDSIYKGFSLFRDAVSLTKRTDIVLLLLGNLGVSDHELNARFDVRELGYLTDGISMRLAYSAADVFVGSSKYEAFGKTLAEAMCCETPVVAFGFGGPRDIVDHKVNGYLAEPFSPRDLAEGVRWVLSYPDPQTLRRRAYDKSVSHFSAGVIAAEYLSLYNEILNNSSID